MPLKTIRFKPGVNRENTRYLAEGRWYDCEKVRFRQGTPEKIGGWARISNNTYLGVARSLWPWAASAGALYLGVGTHLKYYISSGGTYYDITPLRVTTTLPNDPFTANGTSTISVNAPTHGAVAGDFVTYSGATAFSGVTIVGEYQIVSVIDANTYTIDFGSNVAAGSGGGAAVSAAYQINIGADTQLPLVGWGAGGWGQGTWGQGAMGTTQIRIWNNQNFGFDLLYGPKGGALYYWNNTTGPSTRGAALTSLPGASDVPTLHNHMIVSDASRFVLVFGCNDYGNTSIDPMLIRWSDQETAVNWTPAATNQAGSLRLSRGSKISAVLQVRQEILVWTDIALYSLQYLGPPVVWGSQILGDNISIVSDRAVMVAAGTAYWMGEEKFYVYDGRLNTLTCDVRQYVFGDFNFGESQQVFAGSVEEFNEVWWFYCSAGSTTIDRYVVYNYLEQAWYYGRMARTAWIDDSLVSTYPIAATYSNVLVYHELGVNDAEGPTAQPFTAYITSAEFDIEDGHNFGFIWRVLPDVKFDGSDAQNPSVTMTLLPLQNSGSGYNVPPSVGGADSGAIVRAATVPVEQFTGQINVRVRGRQMAFKVQSDSLGTHWQLGAPRIDIRPDGRKS